MIPRNIVKALSLLAALCMAFALCACGGEKQAAEAALADAPAIADAPAVDTAAEPKAEAGQTDAPAADGEGAAEPAEGTAPEQAETTPAEPAEPIDPVEPAEPAVPAEPEEPSEDEYAFWPIDIDNDTYSDRIYLNLTALDEEGYAEPYVELRDGTIVYLPYPVSTSHAGMGTYGTKKLGPMDCIIYYSASWYGGVCEDYYCVFCVKNGEIDIQAENSLRYEVSSVRPLGPVDEEAVMAFIEELNSVWSRESTVLFSTDTVIAQKLIMNVGTGKKLALSGNKPFVWSIFAERYGRGAFDVPDLYGWYYLQEDLSRLDREFGSLPGYPVSGTPQAKLSFANEIMAGIHA